MLTDAFGRKHSYLRISLTEQCNLKCTYCRPEFHDVFSRREKIMTPDEILSIAELFVKHGVNKIRLTGGEPLVRKEFEQILKGLARLPVNVAMTTNGVTIDQHISLLEHCGMKHLNISLDTLKPRRFKEITGRDAFGKVYDNILNLIDHNFHVKINVVLIKGRNDDEIIDFIEWTREIPLSVRFIEFMPFQGNRWDMSRTVSLMDILSKAEHKYSADHIDSIEGAPHDTAKHFRVHGFQGSFAVISTVTQPFCSSCNRMRLTANGHLKNCLFSESELDILTPLRQGDNLEGLIAEYVQAKAEYRGNKAKLEDFIAPSSHERNRSMITIGG